MRPSIWGDTTLPGLVREVEKLGIVYLPHMEERVSLWRGIRLLVGTVVGVGFFGLPFVFAHVGYWVAFFELIVLVAVQILFLGMYADLALAKKGHARFLHIIGDAFELFWNALGRDDRVPYCGGRIFIVCDEVVVFFFEFNVKRGVRSILYVAVIRRPTCGS
jgi:hypothetical protein